MAFFTPAQKLEFIQNESTKKIILLISNYIFKFYAKLLCSSLAFGLYTLWLMMMIRILNIVNAIKNHSSMRCTALKFQFIVIMILKCSKLIDNWCDVKWCELEKLLVWCNSFCLHYLVLSEEIELGSILLT